jgi:hypothetical protein
MNYEDKPDRLHEWGHAAVAGLVGATALTTVHQLARRWSENAPRMDVVAMRGIEKTSAATGTDVPSPSRLYRWALAGDMVANTAYYSLVACGRQPHVWRRGLSLGLAAGAGALTLPRALGLGDPPRSDRIENQIMTVAWYLIGGLAAALYAQRVRG